MWVMFPFGRICLRRHSWTEPPSAAGPKVLACLRTYGNGGGRRRSLPRLPRRVNGAVIGFGEALCLQDTTMLPQEAKKLSVCFQKFLKYSNKTSWRLSGARARALHVGPHFSAARLRRTIKHHGFAEQVAYISEAQTWYQGRPWQRFLQGVVLDFVLHTQSRLLVAWRPN